MAQLESFKSSIQNMLKKTEDELLKRHLELQKKQEKFNVVLQSFDKYADIIQEEILLPGAKYLSDLFENAMEPIAREEFNYRHRILLRFIHCEKYPCTADVTILVIHSDSPDFIKIKFDYLILPTYVTSRYKISEEIQLPMQESSKSSIEAFLKANIEEFLKNYLKARVSY